MTFHLGFVLGDELARQLANERPVSDVFSSSQAPTVFELANFHPDLRNNPVIGRSSTHTLHTGAYRAELETHLSRTLHGPVDAVLRAQAALVALEDDIPGLQVEIFVFLVGNAPDIPRTNALFARIRAAEIDALARVVVAPRDVNCISDLDEEKKRDGYI
jgi:hypothetical protein